MIRSLATSPDGQWAAVRTGREVSLLAAGTGPAVAKIELDGDDVDIALVGPPTVLVAVSRGDAGNKIVVYQPPYLEAVARLDLEIPARLVTTTGPRFAVLSPDNMHCMVVRAAGRALATQKIDVAGPIEFVVGLERNQLLFGLLKKLEVWDAVSGRPLLRPSFQLPPAPRILGPAHGHLWATRVGAEELFVYRLSDGRPFRHHVGAPIRDVISHPASPLIVLATSRGVIKLHCFAHTLTTVDADPTTTAFAQLAVGEDISLLGLPADGSEPWRTTIHGSGAPMVLQMDTAQPVAERPPTPVVETPRAAEPVAPIVDAGPRAGGKQWREALATLGAELARPDTQPELPIVAIDNELGDLAHRLGLSAAARRALVALYALYLVGAPPPSIARLAAVIRDWPEALGQGDLGALALLKKQGGTVRLRRAVTDLLDGTAPRHVRLVGAAAGTPRPGAWRVSREGRTDAEIESVLLAQLGRLAFIEGTVSSALLEARLHGATAIATAIPAERPRPWPRDAGLVLVLYATQTAWVADLPALGDT